MLLVDSGKLDLDRPIETYLSKPLAEYPRHADLAGDARTGKLTARILLDHTSGFANWRWFDDDRKLAFHFEPGSRFAYSGGHRAIAVRRRGPIYYRRGLVRG